MAFSSCYGKSSKNNKIDEKSAELKINMAELLREANANSDQPEDDQQESHTIDIDTENQNQNESTPEAVQNGGGMEDSTLLGNTGEQIKEKKCESCKEHLKNGLWMTIPLAFFVIAMISLMSKPGRNN